MIYCHFFQSIKKVPEPNCFWRNDDIDEKEIDSGTLCSLAMRIYLDSKDHIVLAESFSTAETDAFEAVLHRGSHQLIFSMHNIMECCAPIIQSTNRNSVMRILNRLESMPHMYVAEAKIPAIELMEAVKAFSEGREYSVVNPFVARFDEVISPFSRPATHDYIRYGLAHTIFELWQEDPELFQPYIAESRQLETIRTSDRSRSDYQQHDHNFSNTVARDLRLYNIAFAQESVNDLAAWIWASPSRCPALRLGYEVFHKIVRNVTDSGEESDIPDFAHVDCIPYVDVITLDRRMRGYIGQADRSMGTAYSQKLFADVNGVQTAIQN